MSAATQQPVAHDFTFVHRVYELPVVKTSLNQAHSIITSNSYGNYAYGKAEQLSSSLFHYAEPIQKRLEPQLQALDSYGNKGLDFVEKKFPQVKSETLVQDVVGRARAPADQAVGVAKVYADGIQSRLSPVTEQFQLRIQQTTETLHGLQERLVQTISKLPRDKQSAQESVVAIQKEIESISTYFAQQSKELPAHVHEAVKPILERFSEGYSHVADELKKKDVPVSTKATSVLTYTREQVQPLLTDVANAIKGLINRGKTEADQTADKVSSEVNNKVNGH